MKQNRNKINVTISTSEPNAEGVYEYNRRTYGERIRRYRIEKNLSQPQLAEILRTNKNYVSNWEVGRARPDLNMIPELCRVLGISISAFFGEPALPGELSFEERLLLKNYRDLSIHDRKILKKIIDSMLFEEAEEQKTYCRDHFIRVFCNSRTACAGTDNTLDDRNDGEYIYIRTEESACKPDEVITVSGDSMEPTFSDGDRLLVQYTSQLADGEIGIVIINGEGFVKEFRNSGVYSHNAVSYPFRAFLPQDDVRCVGKVIGKLEKKMLPTKQEMEIIREFETI